MVKVVGIGANVYDTLITVDGFPKEDTKVRADSSCVSGGGPCGTGLVAVSKLGESAAYIGNLADDIPGNFLVEDMKRYGVSTELVNIKEGYASFSSYIWLNTQKATRTCVFHKGNLPPLELSEKQKKAIQEGEILMIDGNEMSAAIEGARLARENGTKVLYDAGGLYEGVENLLPYADVLIPSEEFALGHTGEKSAEAAAKKLMEMYNPQVVVITCGKEGGIILEKDEIKKYMAFSVEAVDTNGAGDVFHGAFAFGMTKGYDYYSCCIFASAVSALKCQKVGARASVPDFKEVTDFLAEHGIVL
ncbi:MAG: bifunctional hydroxymethylpyrimidine kinase/phosphomethylpyrimidine kinase [Clostridia bacterium]|nr:bifunctional hydroxymethylpyrimidine kinase/phosphomethylpyrimidine kinase [Clostridia bacterium]